MEVAEIGETMENYGTFKRKVTSSYHKWCIYDKPRATFLIFISYQKYCLTC